MLPAEGKGEDRRYLESCVEIVKIASAFRAFGIEARHMRTFKHAAERDAGVFAQVISPMLQQRNPEARRRARGSLLRSSSSARPRITPSCWPRSTPSAENEHPADSRIVGR